MDRSTLQRIVLVRTRFGQGKPKFGTGFRLGSHRVLTSFHVVSQESDGVMVAADPGDVELFANPRGDKKLKGGVSAIHRPMKQIEVGSRLCPIDIAVLADTFDEDLPPWQDFVREAPGKPCNWTSAGFLKASSRISEVNPPTLEGRAGPIKERLLEFDLSVTSRSSAPPEDENGEPLGWSGISGGPVVVSLDSRDHLLGIIRTSESHLPNTLGAVSIPILLENKAFQDLFLEEVKEHAGLVKLKRRLERLLREEPVLHVVVGKLFPACQQGIDEACLEALASAEKNLSDLKEVFRDLRDRQRRVEGEVDEENRFTKLARVLAPLLGGPGIQRQASSRGTIELDVEDLCFAEMGIAFGDGRPVSYRHTGKKERPSLSVPISRAESGILFQEAAKDQLAINQQVLETFFLDYLAHPPLVRDRSETLSDAKAEGWEYALAEMKSWLEFLVRDGRAPYLAVDREFKNVVPEPLQEALLSELRALLPELRQYVLAGDKKRGTQERAATYPLLALLGVIAEDL